MDLGSIIGTLGSSYIQAKYQQPSTVYGGAIQAQPALGLPFVDVIPEADTGHCGGRQLWDPKGNCGQGKWIKKSRKRRKRLATHSDLKDLAALKGVLGGGKAFETWIATHS